MSTFTVTVYISISTPVLHSDSAYDHSHAHKICFPPTFYSCMPSPVFNDTRIMKVTMQAKLYSA